MEQTIPESRSAARDKPEAGTVPDGPVLCEDGDIVALLFARDEQAVELCRMKYGGRCRAAAENILASPEDAEECLNDTWLRAWNAIPPDRPRYLGAYLAAVTRRVALDRYRAETAEKRGGGEVPLCLDELAEAVGGGESWGSGGSPTDEETRDHLRDALNRFLAGEKPAARRIFIWRYWYAYPLAEVARLAGKSEGAVKMSLGRTKRRLKAYLEKEGFSV